MSMNRIRRIVPAVGLAAALLSVSLAGAASTASAPVGDWRMNEGSGTVLVDSSASANNGAIIGNPTWVAGQHGQAIRFDGTADYATVADNSSLDISGAITMAAWVKPEKTGDPVSDQEGHDGSDGRLRAVLVLGRERCSSASTTATGPDTYRINSPTSYPTNGVDLDALAATYDGTTIRLYVNGVQEAGNLAGPAAITTNNLALGIGAQADGTSKLQGAMDDVLLYNTALSASEIAALAGAAPGNTPPTLNPVGNKSAQVGSQLAFTATATDPDAGDTLTFSLANGSVSVPAGPATASSSPGISSASART